MDGRVRSEVRVEGIVQGVGFRPFVHQLARRLGLSGLVGNDAGGVFVEVEGAAGAVEAFVRALWTEAPPLAVVDRVTIRPLPLRGERGFAIAPSVPRGERTALVSPDSATCADCLRELRDPADRRHRYPFVNCTNCGPRFTIVRDVPYDRPNTTMAGFAMCADCAREYHDPSTRPGWAWPASRTRPCSSRRRPGSAWSRGAPRWSRTPLPAWRPDGAAASAWWSASTAATLAEELMARGADLVVADLGELRLDGGSTGA
jgi:hydrogenase maturation protein HypF